MFDLLCFLYDNASVGLSCITNRFYTSKMENFDDTRFKAAPCEHLYYGDVHKTKLLPESSISLDSVEEKLPEFHAHQTTTRWTYFAPDPCYANKH